jgi:hypothetical protein
MPTQFQLVVNTTVRSKRICVNYLHKTTKKCSLVLGLKLTGLFRAKLKTAQFERAKVKEKEKEKDESR